MSNDFGAAEEKLENSAISSFTRLQQPLFPLSRHHHHHHHHHTIIIIIIITIIIVMIITSVELGVKTHHHSFFLHLYLKEKSWVANFGMGYPQICPSIMAPSSPTHDHHHHCHHQEDHHHHHRQRRRLKVLAEASVWIIFPTKPRPLYGLIARHNVQIHHYHQNIQIIIIIRLFK